LPTICDVLEQLLLYFSDVLNQCNQSSVGHYIMLMHLLSRAYAAQYRLSSVLQYRDTLSYRSWDHPQSVVHLLVPPSRLERVINRLADDGYEEGPEPSKEFLMSEGGRLELVCHGNIRRDDEQQLTPLVFHFHGDVESHFQLSPVDKFLQKQLNSYRGVIDVYQVTQNSEVDSDGEPSKYTRKLVASHHVNIPKEVRRSDSSVRCTTAAYIK